MFCYANEFGSKLASKREFVNLRPCRRFEKIQTEQRVVLKRFLLTFNVDGIMWKGSRISLVLLCSYSMLLPVLTNEGLFGKKSPLKAGKLSKGTENCLNTFVYDLFESSNCEHS